MAINATGTARCQSRLKRLPVTVSSFSPGWRLIFIPGALPKPGLKALVPAIPALRTTVRQEPLVPVAKIAEANAKLEHRSKVCSLVVCAQDI